MKKFEYKRIQYHYGNLITVLNKEGQNGWEAIRFTPVLEGAEIRPKNICTKRQINIYSAIIASLKVTNP